VATLHHQILHAVYRASERLPEAERATFGQRLRRSARQLCLALTSLAQPRGGSSQHLVQRALLAGAELECLLLIAEELGWLSTIRTVRLIDQLDGIRRQLTRSHRREAA